MCPGIPGKVVFVLYQNRTREEAPTRARQRLAGRRIAEATSEAGQATICRPAYRDRQRHPPRRPRTHRSAARNSPKGSAPNRPKTGARKLYSIRGEHSAPCATARHCLINPNQTRPVVPEGHSANMADSGRERRHFPVQRRTIATVARRILRSLVSETFRA